MRDQSQLVSTTLQTYRVKIEMIDSSKVFFNFTGPIVAFNSAIMSWKVRSLFDINERSLALFTILDPFPELLLIGYGSPLVSLARPSR